MNRKILFKAQYNQALLEQLHHICFMQRITKLPN